MEKEWKVSLEFKANSFEPALMQVLHMTIGGRGTGGGAVHGDRTPAIFTHSTNGFLIASSVGNDHNDVQWIQALPSFGEWIKIEITQEVEVTEMIYSITFGGKKLSSKRNSRPSRFENVKVFSSSSWDPAASGFIKNLVIENKKSGKEFNL